MRVMPLQSLSVRAGMPNCFLLALPDLCHHHGPRFPTRNPDTAPCCARSIEERKQYVGAQKMFVRSPAYARFFISESSDAEGKDGATISNGPTSNGTFSAAFMTVHVKAPEKNAHWITQGTVRDLGQLGKLVKAIRVTNAATLGNTPVVMVGDFNMDCGYAVYRRLYGKGWVPTLPPGMPTNVRRTLQVRTCRVMGKAFTGLVYANMLL